MKQYNVSNRIKFYEDKKKLVDSGSFNYIPFYGFDKLQNYVPGIIPGVMYKVTSHMGVGKTQISKYLFVYQTMLFALKNKINFKVIYFALEESKEQFIDGLFVHILKRVFGIQLNHFSLTGVFKTALTEAELNAIKKAEAMVSNFLMNVEVVDNKYKPTDMYNTCEYYAKKWGSFAKNAEGENISYKANDPNQIVLVVADHISLLEAEYDKKTERYFDERKTISLWHTNYCRRVFCKMWNWSVLNVQQQSLDSEKQQFTSRGDTIINKIIPSLDGLANNKEVGRDDFVALGLFAPARYDIDKYKGYHIVNGTPESFGDRFRSLHLLKNRFGHPNKVLPLYFDGRYTYFRELPDIADVKMNNFYKLLTK